MTDSEVIVIESILTRTVHIFIPLFEQAIEDGTISVVSSDHSPAPPADKKLEEGDFLKAWGGISGLQFSLPATWTKMSKLGMDFVKLAGE